jgi:hypothetical protein
MANATRTDIVFLALVEVGVGLAAGLGVAIATMVVGACIEPLAGLFESIAYTLLAGLAAMIGGVVAVGYCYLRAEKRKINLLKRLLQAVVGLAAGVGAFCAVPWVSAPHALINLAVVLLPLLGLLIGFNHRIPFSHRVCLVAVTLRPYSFMRKSQRHLVGQLVRRIFGPIRLAGVCPCSPNRPLRLRRLQAAAVELLH